MIARVRVEHAVRSGALVLIVLITRSATSFAQAPSAPPANPEPAPTPPAASAPPPAVTPSAAAPAFEPLGYSGAAAEPGPPDGDFLPVPDRWRIGFPDWSRFTRGALLNPYRQNVLKGDYPIFGQKTFLNFSAVSDTVVESRIIPVASDVSAQNPGSEEFFGNGHQESLVQEVILSLSLFHGDAAFRPRDWEIRVTPVGNFNAVRARENGVLFIDPSEGDHRTDMHVGLQELFAEAKLFDVSTSYDFVSVRAGIQGFTSDFRGFVFSDNNAGVRLFGTLDSNRFQWNAAIFEMIEKDTNSGLNTIFDKRGQNVGVFNFFAQDFLFPGFTEEVSFVYDDDRPTVHYDENGFLVRPSVIGDAARHALHVAYIELAGEGHIGRLNISHAFTEAYGTDDHNPIAGRRTRVNAQMASLEASVDVDWWRPVLSLLYASGDSNPTDGQARGFSAVLDNPRFAGGPFSFWNRQAIPLTQTGVKLVNANSLFPDLRSSKDEGQASFVNPGLYLAGLFFDFKLTQKLSLDINCNYLRFARSEPLELVLFQPHIHREIGWDYGVGLRWRPFLDQQFLVEAGAAGFEPGQGFRDIYSSNCSTGGCGAKANRLYQAFASLVVAY
ncbi:MAG TPA: hypothetical protein VGK26_10210 [Thermoanaerobaculia bacterium]